MRSQRWRKTGRVDRGRPLLMAGRTVTRALSMVPREGIWSYRLVLERPRGVRCPPPRSPTWRSYLSTHRTPTAYWPSSTAVMVPKPRSWSACPMPRRPPCWRRHSTASCCTRSPPSGTWKRCWEAHPPRHGRRSPRCCLSWPLPPRIPRPRVWPGNSRRPATAAFCCSRRPTAPAGASSAGRVATIASNAQNARTADARSASQ